MHAVTDRPVRTTITIDAEVYAEIRRLAHEDDRSITRYTNRVLAAHVAQLRERGRPTE